MFDRLTNRMAGPRVRLPRRVVAGAQLFSADLDTLWLRITDTQEHREKSM